MYISLDHDIVLIVLSSSIDELFARDKNSCMTPRNAYIYNEN